MASPSPSPDDSSSQITPTRSITTLDGYVSCGKAPTRSAVLRDHAMLQDFVAYLELRLKSQNLSILRRIFADFLNEHEYTLIPMMHQGCTIITIFPMERTSARRRRQAEFLLSKPKTHLDFSRGCVFLYLQYRTATRNMALLKHLFLEFIGQRETSLLAFVERGCQVISVIPFELPRITPPARLLPPRPEQHASPRAVENVVGEEQATSEVAGVEKIKKKEVAVRKSRQSQPSPARADVAEQQPASMNDEKRCHSVVKTKIGSPAAVALNEPEIVPKRRQKRNVVASTAGSACSRDNEDIDVPPTSNGAAVLTLKRGIEMTSDAVSPQQQLTAVEEQDEEDVPTEASVAETLLTFMPNETSSTEAPGNVTGCRSKHAGVVSTNESADSTVDETVNEPWISSPTAKSVLQRGETLTSGAVPSQRKPTAVVDQDERNVPSEASTSERVPTEASPSQRKPTAVVDQDERNVPSEASTSERVPTEALPSQRKPTAVVDQDERNVPSEASTSERVPTEALPSQRKPTAAVNPDERNVPSEASTSERVPTKASPTTALSAEALEDTTRCQNKRAGVASTNEAASNEVWQDKNALAPTAGSILICDETLEADAVLSRDDSVATAVDQAEVMPNDVLPALAIQTSTTEAVTSELEISKKRQLKCVEDARSNEANQESKVTLVLNPAAELAATQGRNTEAGDVPAQQPPSSEQGEASQVEASPTKAPQTEVPTEVLSDAQPKRKRERNIVTDEKRSRKRGKPFMTEEMCRSQLDLTRKIGILEAQSPWKTSHGNLPAPFDAERYPELARKFSRFWRKHVRAVWERKFWAPMSRKLCLPAFNKRNNRQLMAKNAFELLIVSVYEEFGAAFFVKMDTQKERHPGWWYRGPVVALFALQQIKSEDTMWDYVKNQAFLRFPDCNLPIPLTAANSGAVRLGHKRESESMWMVNHRLTAGILREIAALKAEKQAHEQEVASQVTTMEHDRDSKNEIALVEALELM